MIVCIPGRVASGVALAPEPPRATRSQPEPIRTAEKNVFFHIFCVEPGLQAGSTQKNRVEPAQPHFLAEPSPGLCVLSTFQGCVSLVLTRASIFIYWI